MFSRFAPKIMRAGARRFTSSAVQQPTWMGSRMTMRAGISLATLTGAAVVHVAAADGNCSCALCSRNRAQCAPEGDAAAAAAGAALGGLIVGGLVGYFAQKQETTGVTEKFEKYWPRKIMILFGAPGAGKGTQAPKIVSTLDIPQLSTGDMMRAVDKESAIGKEMHGYMKAGKLVPDAVVVGIVEARIQKPDCASGFILDGFPRTQAQAAALDAMLARRGESVNNVIAFDVPESVLEERICGRWMHKASGRSYHVKFAPPKSMQLDASGKPVAASMKDDVTGGALYQRSDDTASALKSRLAEYNSKTTPILEHYRPHGVVTTINANQKIDKVWGEVEPALLSGAQQQSA